MRNTLVIVGAGFSGTVLAANLLRRPPAHGADIVLVERNSAMGRGVAYAARDFPYLLNVPAGRLSADSGNPHQFLHYAQTRLPNVDSEDFLPRALYGDYLQDLLCRAEREAPANVRLVRVFGEVTGIQRTAGGAPAVQLPDRAPIVADIVILALGNPEAPLPPWAGELRDHSAFRQDPRDLPKTLTAEHSVLIVGNGLTMADAASALSRHADRVPTLHTISRRGVIPKPQTAFHPHALRGSGEALLAHTHSLRRLLRACRDMAREVEKLGGDWREAVAFVRNLAPALWRQLPDVERRRFVRHLHVHWDTFRHRLPPQLMARIEALRRSGKLQIKAGRIQRVIAREHQLQVSWRPRGSDVTSTLTVDLVVNATGPNYAIERSVDPLLMSLRGSGLVSSDALNLGMRTGGFGACVDAQGRESQYLYYLGPMLRADHLDATAAAELRDHAEQLAEHLVGALSGSAR
ncbi:MAG: FAD/NAD(P)-binding protein [Pseudomonadota bacterium]|nr:FAD/NAD(P)-binding protein [Pseudomonadota bacterium]